MLVRKVHLPNMLVLPFTYLSFLGHSKYYSCVVSPGPPSSPLAWVMLACPHTHAHGRTHKLVDAALHIRALHMHGTRGVMCT